jgi:Cu(I)/Ag(I) efflux system membrane fusion protein
MTALSITPARLLLAGAALAVIAGAGGYGLAHLQGNLLTAAPAGPHSAGRKVLYWYDPMVPAQPFEKAGKSPFMDMQLIPRYADDGPAAAAGVQIDPAAIQSLGVRLASVQRGDFAQSLDVTGVLDFNQRDVAIVQARAAGFVQRV